MAIVRMKHLRLIAVSSLRDDLLRDLSKLGCVEVTEAMSADTPAEWNQILRPAESDAGALRMQLSELQSALSVLGRHAKRKRGLFAPRTPVEEGRLFDPEFIKASRLAAEEINRLDRALTANFTEEGRLVNKKDSLLPWTNLDVPLDTASGGAHFAAFGVAPATNAFSVLEQAALQASDTAALYLSSSDREQHYFLVLCHRKDQEAVLDALKPYGFSRNQFKDLEGTASQNVQAIDHRIDALHQERDQIKKDIAARGGQAASLEQATDALDVLLRREQTREKLRTTEKTIFLEGWFPERESGRLAEFLDTYRCAYEIRDPLEEEEPPILTYNSKMIAPFGIITDMYSPPSYRSIDPNPLIAPFFAVFFGIMLSDAAYGLLLLLAGAVVLLKFKPRGFMRQAMILVVICGVSTFVWGALFGGFFGDAISSVYTLITGEPFSIDLALWFNPLNDPMKMLIFCFILGGIHIFTGMAVQAYLLIRDGHIWDAVFDVGFWWVLFAGAVFLILGQTSVGLWLAVAGALGLLLTQGRHEKKFLKKITKGLSSLYDITSYLGDILSYSRLLALSLATAVIASVVNTMGVLTGPIGFIIVFLIGHTFNIAINLIGSFVHTARLQYVEFFGKFYQGGGTPFEPLDMQTKYVDILKEEQ